MTDAQTAAPATERVVRAPLDYAALVLVIAAACLLVSGVIYAFAYAAETRAGSTQRFWLLAQAATPFVAGFALTSVALVAHERRTSSGATIAASGAALAVGAVVSLVALLLAANGLIVDVTREGVGFSFRLSSVVGRFGTMMLAAFALWLAAITPLRRR